MGNNHTQQNDYDTGTGISFTKQEISILYQNFRSLDTDGNGTLDKKEFFDIPELQENPIVQRIVSVFDKNRDEKISFYEFIVGLNMLNSSSLLEEKYRLAFQIYDMDRDGYISNGDLYNSLKLFTVDQLDEIQIQQLADRTMLQADFDLDGKISYEDFVNFAKEMDIGDMFSLLMFNN